MNEFNKIILHNEFNNLIVIIELWIPVLEQLQKMHEHLQELPLELSLLKKQLQQLKRAEYCYRSNFNEKELKTVSKKVVFFQKNQTIIIEPTFQDSIERLETAMPRLKDLEYKIGNLLALRERIEALQQQINVASTCSDRTELKLKQVWLKKQITNEYYRHNSNKQNFLSKLVRKLQRKSQPFLVFSIVTLTIATIATQIVSLDLKNLTKDKSPQEKITNTQDDR